MSFPTLRVIMAHMIVEVAAHAGHADAVRELIDGKQWVVVWPLRHPGQPLIASG